MGVIGILEGPPHYYFYKFMDHYFPGRSTMTITKKIVIDQIVGCPLFNLQFFMGMSLMEGKDIRESWAEFIAKFPIVYTVSSFVN